MPRPQDSHDGSRAAMSGQNMPLRLGCAYSPEPPRGFQPVWYSRLNEASGPPGASKVPSPLRPDSAPVPDPAITVQVPFDCLPSWSPTDSMTKLPVSPPIA